MKKSPLVVIVGPTASGKSALAMQLAEQFNGELICADSRTVYKGMDIGTAKPSKEEQTKIKHHLIDIIDPSKKYNVANFQSQALEIIEDITSRDKLPIMVGGTGLYVDSILFDFTFEDTEARDETNPRHAKRAEPVVYGDVRPSTLILGIDVDKEALDKRIKDRVDRMIEGGLKTEVRRIVTEFGQDCPGMTAVGYKEWLKLLNGVQTIEQTADLITIHTRQYAKRQKTWFKRNPHIKWVQQNLDVQKIVMQFLQQT